MGKTVEITDANFQKEVLSSIEPVLVDFWAVWCGPCKMVAPIVEEIAEKYGNKLKVGKFDVDKSRQVPANYGIRSIPTLLVFKNGQVVEQIIGAVPKDHLLKKLERHI
jgi:thioredoxin 1